MKIKAPPFTKTEATAISLKELEYHAQGWVLDGECRQLSPRTISSRRDLLHKLVWFLQQRECAACGPYELRAFLAYVGNGHQDEAGRWGNRRMTAAVRPG